MPAPAGTKRVKGVQVHRPFIYGSTATPFDPSAPRPAGIPSEHTHRWTVFIRPLTPDHDITHWLKKVQFKLHETYANSTRTIEAPQPFEVSETGWGEFEVQMKLFFVPEANEKAATLWHALKLHPFGPRAEEMRERRETVRSLCYEEVVFQEPVEGFFGTLTGDGVGGGKGGKGGAGGKALRGKILTAEVPVREARDIPWCGEREGAEVQTLREAGRVVEGLVKKERALLAEREKKREELGRDGGGEGK